MPKNLPEMPSVRLVDIGALPLNDWNHYGSIYPNWRLYWNQEPGAWIESNGQHALGPDRLVLVPPFTRVDLRSKSPVRHLYLCFEIAPPWTYAQRRVFTSWIGTESVVSASKLYQEVEHDDGRMISSLTCLSLISNGLLAVPQSDWLNNPVDARIQKVLLDIEANLSQPLTNEHIAADLCMTPNSFGRLFRKEVGTSPHRYILMRRLAMAGHLLRQGLEIEQAAQRCGFCDRYYFTRMFIQSFGMPPGQFRQRGTTVTLSSLKTP